MSEREIHWAYAYRDALHLQKEFLVDIPILTTVPSEVTCKTCLEKWMDSAPKHE
jgi:hypothetical protein